MKLTQFGSQDAMRPDISGLTTVNFARGTTNTSALFGYCEGMSETSGDGHFSQVCI